MDSIFLVPLPTPVITDLYYTPFPLFTFLLIQKLEPTSNYEKEKAIFFTSPSLKLFQFSTSFTPIISCKTKLLYHAKSMSIAQPTCSNLFTSENQTKCIKVYTLHLKKKLQSKENEW